MTRSAAGSGLAPARSQANRQPSPGALPGRPPAVRRHAARNYHRILGAAREVFGESGADASMEEIAARAGVGVGFDVWSFYAEHDDGPFPYR